MSHFSTIPCIVRRGGGEKEREREGEGRGGGREGRGKGRGKGRGRGKEREVRGRLGGLNVSTTVPMYDITEIRLTRSHRAPGLTLASAGTMVVERGTSSFSLLIMAVTFWSSVNWSFAIPSKHFFR